MAWGGAASLITVPLVYPVTPQKRQARDSHLQAPATNLFVFCFSEFFRISFYNFLRYLSKCTELKQQLIITDLLRSDTPTFKIPLVQLCPLTLQYSLSTAEAQKYILLKRHGLIPTNTVSQSRKNNFQSSKWKKHTTLHI